MSQELTELSKLIQGGISTTAKFSQNLLVNETKANLITVCKSLGISGYSNKSKDELMSMLTKERRRAMRAKNKSVSGGALMGSSLTEGFGLLGGGEATVVAPTEVAVAPNTSSSAPVGTEVTMPVVESASAVEGVPAVEGTPAVDGTPAVEGVPAVEGTPAVEGKPVVDGTPAAAKADNTNAPQKTGGSKKSKSKSKSKK
jgi:hypothetical protein